MGTFKVKPTPTHQTHEQYEEQKPVSPLQKVVEQSSKRDYAHGPDATPFGPVKVDHKPFKAR